MPIGKNRSAIAEINITPLVDVMLVILIIFMVVAPTMQHGVKVDVPEATLVPIDSSQVQVVVSVEKSGKIHISYGKTTRETTFKQLGAALKNIFERSENKELFIRADKKVPYGTVMETMAEIRRAGISKIGMITEPE